MTKIATKILHPSMIPSGHPSAKGPVISERIAATQRIYKI